MIFRSLAADILRIEKSSLCLNDWVIARSVAKINCYLRQKTQRQKCLILLIQQTRFSIGFFDTRQKSARGLRERPAATGASDKGGSRGKRASSPDSTLSSDSGAAMRGGPLLWTGRPGQATKEPRGEFSLSSVLGPARSLARMARAALAGRF